MAGRNDVLVAITNKITTGLSTDIVLRSTLSPENSEDLFDNTQWPDTNNLVVIQGRDSIIIGEEKNNNAPQIQEIPVKIHCYVKHDNMTTRDVNLALLLDSVKALFDGESTLNGVVLSCTIEGETIKQDISPPYAGGEVEILILYRRN